MQPRLQFCLAAAIGALFLYCTPQAVESVLSDAMTDAVGDAQAQDPPGEPAACCKPPLEQFVKIGEWSLAAPVATNTPTMVTDPIDVSGYRQLVGYWSNVGGVNNSYCAVVARAEFRADATAAFGTTGTIWHDTGGRRLIDGPEVRLRLRAEGTSLQGGSPTHGCPPTATFILAGVR